MLKCARPTNRAWTIDNATGLSFQYTRLAIRVCSWAKPKAQRAKGTSPRQHQRPRRYKYEIGYTMKQRSSLTLSQLTWESSNHTRMEGTTACEVRNQEQPALRIAYSVRMLDSPSSQIEQEWTFGNHAGKIVGNVADLAAEGSTGNTEDSHRQ